MLGEKVKIEEGNSVKFGLFDDVDENGFMVLKTVDGYETITHGDASLR